MIGIMRVVPVVGRALACLVHLPRRLWLILPSSVIHRRTVARKRRRSHVRTPPATRKSPRTKAWSQESHRISRFRIRLASGKMSIHKQ